jgi:hypothetical protein
MSYAVSWDLWNSIRSIKNSFRNLFEKTFVEVMFPLKSFVMLDSEYRLILHELVVHQTFTDCNITRESEKRKRERDLKWEEEREGLI